MPLGISWKHYKTEAAAESGKRILEKKYKVVTQVYKSDTRSGYDVGYCTQSKRK